MTECCGVLLSPLEQFSKLAHGDPSYRCVTCKRFGYSDAFDLGAPAINRLLRIPMNKYKNRPQRKGN